jgi:hypothetical protein
VQRGREHLFFRFPGQHDPAGEPAAFLLLPPPGSDVTLYQDAVGHGTELKIARRDLGDKGGPVPALLQHFESGAAASVKPGQPAAVQGSPQHRDRLPDQFVAGVAVQYERRRIRVPYQRHPAGRQLQHQDRIAGLLEDNAVQAAVIGGVRGYRLKGFRGLRPGRSVQSFHDYDILA